MALIRSGLSMTGNPMRLLGGASPYVINRPNWTQPGGTRGFYAGEATVVGGASIANTAAFPNGHEPPSSWIMAPRGGGFSTYKTLEASHTLVAALSQGVNIGAAMTSDGALSFAQLSLVVSMASTMLMNCAVTATMQAAAALSASLVASGDITGAIKVLASLVATLNSDNDVSTSTLRGTASLAAELTTEGVVVSGNPAALAAAVWEYLLGSVQAGEALTRTSPTSAGVVVADVGNAPDSFKTDLSEAADNHWKDALVSFASGTLRGQVKKVLSYDGTTKIITVGPAPGFTGTPSNNDTFILVNR